MPLHTRSRATRASLLALVTALAAPATLAAQKIAYPVTRTVDQVDTYLRDEGVRPVPLARGREIAPRRRGGWRRRTRSRSTTSTRIPYRDALKARLTQLNDYAKYRRAVPPRRAATSSRRTTGCRTRACCTCSRGSTARRRCCSTRTPSRRTARRASPASTCRATARYAGVRRVDRRLRLDGIPRDGDRHEAARCPTSCKWAKVSGIAWQGDGFYYSRYDGPRTPSPRSRRRTRTTRSTSTASARRRRRTASCTRTPPTRSASTTSATTEDERFAILNVSDRGKGKKGNALFFRDAARDAWKPLVPEVGDDTYMRRRQRRRPVPACAPNRNAPNGRVVLDRPERRRRSRSGRPCSPERAEPLGRREHGGRQAVRRRTCKDVTTRAYVYDLTGQAGERDRAARPSARRAASAATTTTAPCSTRSRRSTRPAVDRTATTSRRGSRRSSARPTIPGFRPATYETKQVFYTSKDGTRVPMFLTHREGPGARRPQPDAALRRTAASTSRRRRRSARAARAARAGRRLRARRTCAAAASTARRGTRRAARQEAERVRRLHRGGRVARDARSTRRRDKLAIHGGSNGGLLVGAVANQRPDLFGAVHPAGRRDGHAALPQVHDRLELDRRLRLGRRPAASSRRSRAYSPLHNLKPGTWYPATLVTTADHDDRVVPAHSFKYAAALQAAQGGDAPGAHPHRHEVGARGEQHDEGDRADGRPLRVRLPGARRPP